MLFPDQNAESDGVDSSYRMPEYYNGPPPLSVESAKAKLAKFAAAIDDMAAQIAAVEVVDEESQLKMVEMTAQATRLQKDIDAKRKAVIGDADSFVRSVNAFVRVQFTTAVEKVVRAGKRKLADYAQRLEMERRKREAAEREAAARLQAQIDAEAKAAGIEPVTVPAPVVPKQTGPVRTEAGTASTVSTWRHELTDFAAVPDEFKMLNEPLIRLAIKNGRREIAGLRIYEDKEIRIRF